MCAHEEKRGRDYDCNDCVMSWIEYSIMEYNIALTALGTTPGLCIRADLMAWKMSATPSVFRRSNWEWMQMKVPVRPTPSLHERESLCLQTLQLPNNFYLIFTLQNKVFAQG